MCLKPKQGKFKDVQVPLFFLNGNKIVHVNKEKYLGYVICDNNTDDDDMQREIRSIFAKVNTLCRNFRECDDMVKSKLFRATVLASTAVHFGRTIKPVQLNV